MKIKLKTKRFTLIGYALCSFFTLPLAHAWGRHDLITKLALNSREFGDLQTVLVRPEPIEKAAPDLLARVIPGIEKWCLRYHREHDTRYAWTKPVPIPGASAREALLWALEDNMGTPLIIPPEEQGKKEKAADILIRHVDEPDGMLDEALDRPPYLNRLRASMSVFLGNDVHTHAFRHYYVPSSLLPPILEPRGIAPYRAGLYALLAQGAFETGHSYWGYRFLAWSIHYVQDVTQPWHTIFLPNLSFLSFSKAKMKKEVSALHYLTEAFSDTWILRTLQASKPPKYPRTPPRELASEVQVEGRAEGRNDPWAVAEITENLGRAAHSQASLLADQARSFFQPVVDQLNDRLKSKMPFIEFGGSRMPASMLDFSGNGSGATRFLMPIWQGGFKLASERDQLMQTVLAQLDAAIAGSRLVIKRTLDLEIKRPS